MDHADRIYKGGDEMKVTIQSEAAGYLYLFYLTAENKTWVLFPNFVQKDNAIPAGQLVHVPAGARFRLRVGPPYGKEVLKALVSTKLLDVAGLRPEDLTKKDVTEIDPAKIGEILPVVKDAPAQWAEHAVEVTTVDPKTPPTTKKERRVGLFVGVGKYLDPMTPLAALPARRKKVRRRDEGTLRPGRSDHLDRRKRHTGERRKSRATNAGRDDQAGRYRGVFLVRSRQSVSRRRR